jgi:hypothetical protein
LNQNRSALDSYFDVFSSREPVSTSLENTLVRHADPLALVQPKCYDL